MDYLDKLELSKTKLIVRYPFLGYISTRMSFSEDDKVSKFSINPKGEVRFNRWFLENRVLVRKDDELLLAMLAHEVMHIAFMHFDIDETKANAQLLNLAKDLEVNDTILHNLNIFGVDLDSRTNFYPSVCNHSIDTTSISPEYVRPLGFAPLPNGLFTFNDFTFNFREVPAEEIYRQLLEKAPLVDDFRIQTSSYNNTNAIKGFQKNDNPLQFSGTDFGFLYANNFDSEFEDDTDDEETSVDNTSSSEDNNAGFDTHNSYGISEAELEELSEKWEETIVCAQYHEKEQENDANDSRKRSSYYRRKLQEILKPKVDWRAVLRKRLTNIMPYDFSYDKPALRSYSVGFYEPHILRKPLGITVCIDVSGSISSKVLNEFMSEVIGILEQANDIKVRRLFWSTTVDGQNDRIFTKRDLEDLRNEDSIHSGGGTEISCVKDYLDKNPNNQTSSLIIFLTDGLVDNEFKLPPKSLIVISPDGDDESFKNRPIPVVKMHKRKKKRK